MNTIEEKIEKPSDRITVTVNGKEQEVFMSGGLIRTLVPYYMNTITATEILTEFTTQNDIIVECVKPRNKRGETNTYYDIEDFEINREDANKLIAWVTEHVLHFFIDNVTSTQRFQERNKPQVETLMKLMQSQNGTQASMQTNASAGPSI